VPFDTERNLHAPEAKNDFGHAKAWQISTTGISVRHGPGLKLIPMNRLNSDEPAS
jgi:hypothetical protein